MYILIVNGNIFVIIVVKQAMVYLSKIQHSVKNTKSHPISYIKSLQYFSPRFIASKLANSRLIYGNGIINNSYQEQYLSERENTAKIQLLQSISEK